jgi:hypothetical protein
MTVASPFLPNPVSNFTSTVKSLLELLELPEEDDYGTLRPTDHAFKRAIELLLNAYESLGERFPRGFASTDEEGGIRINWRERQKDCRLCLFCPANPEGKAYIYHQSGEEYASEESISEDILMGWLEWFDRA